MTSTRFFVRFFYATFFLLVCMAPQALFAQQKVFNFNVVPAAEAEGMQVYVSSLNLGKEGKTGEAKLQAGKFVVSLDFSNTELYNVVIIKNNVQNILPFYSGAREKVANVDVKCENNRVVVSDNSVNNKALFAFNEVLMQKGMALWSGIALTTEQQKQFIASYKTAADSIVAHYKCSPTVKKYIEINGYTSAYNAYTSLPRALKIKRSEVAFEIEDVLPHPGEVLDHALTGLFPGGKLASALNVQGIPHFLIYDKEGKLHTYKAMRPSSGDAIKKILKNFN